MFIAALPALIAILNGIAAVLLCIGLYLIRQRRIVAHRRVMISAFIVSSVFLFFYLLHKYLHGIEHYHGHGVWRAIYFAILIPHVALAMTVPFFAIALIWLGLSERYKRHKAIAHIGWPVWMFVSVTGVIVYIMLYHFNPPA